MPLSPNNNSPPIITTVPQNTTLSIESDNQDKNAHNISDKNENTKIIEAKTAIVLLNDHYTFTKNQYTQWRLSILFKSYYKNEKNEVMNILYISSNPEHSWLSEHNKKNDILPYWDPQKKEPNINHHQQEENNTIIEKYIITPKTNIITFMNETRLVYILDLSLSSATVGNTQSKILLSSVFNTLVNSLKSVIQPFHLDQNMLIRPTIRISVLVDCSPFASNINVIPMLYNHPTIRVFLQNKILTSSNLDHIIDDLYKQFLSLQNELNQFLIQLQKKRRKMGYDLDVSLEEDIITEQSDSSNNDINSSKNDKKDDMDQSNDNGNKNKILNVWGIGKTGANLSRILQVGIFAFDLLPNYGRSQLIFITDGSLQLSSMGSQSSVNNNNNSSQQAQTQPSTLSQQSQEDIITGYLKQFTEKDIQFHVILIALSINFIPGRNFGFLPDNDMLKYIAFSTGGSVTNADQYECIPIINQMDHPNNSSNNSSDSQKEDEDGYYDSEDALTIRPKHHHHQHYRHRRHNHHHHHHNIRKYLFIKTNDDNNTIIYDSTSTITYPLNICHRQFILRENHLERTRYFEHPFSKINNSHIWQYNFPWDPHSIVPPIDSRLLKYREYPLLDNVSTIVAARARDGFQLQSVFFTNKKKTHIQLTMVLRWQCHIFIEYRIKSLWLNNSDGNDFFERMVSPEAEIYIRCDVEFAHMLQNWNLLKKRVQMVNIMLARQRVKNPNFKSSSSSSTSASAPTVLPMYTKVERILTCLYQIFDSDKTLKQYTTQLTDENDLFTLKNKFLLFWHHQQQIPSDINNNNNDSTVTTAMIDQNKSNQDHHIPSHYNNWYDFDSIDLLVGDISPYMTPKLATNYNQSFSQRLQGQLNEKLIEIVQLVDEKWADFHYQEKDGKMAFIKWMNSSSSSPSFCEVRLHHIYGRCVALRLCYFNAYQNKQQCQQLKNDLLSIVKHQKYITICSRPLPLLLLRDKSHFIFSNEDIILKYKNTKNKIFLTSSSYCQTHPSNFNLWYLSLNRGFIGKYIVREYLNHIIWAWPVCKDDYYQQHGMMPISDIIFQSLCQTRLNHGYQLIFSIPNHTHFYKESDKGFGIQYFIQKTKQGIRTELWVEPLGCFYWIKHATLEIDQSIISQLITFDQLHKLGRSCNETLSKPWTSISPSPLINRNQNQDIEREDGCVKTMLLCQLFDISTVLRNSPFILMCFSCPPFHQMLSNVNDPPLFLNIPDTAYHSVDGLLLSDIAKKQLSTLSLHNQYIAFLQYYFDMGLNEMTDNSPVHMVDQSNPEFWKLLVLSAANQSVFNGIHDLNQTRCFISIINSRSFYLIIIPELNYFISYLYRSDNNNRTNTTTAKTKKDSDDKQLGCYLFECTRQKPMAPKSDSSNSINDKHQVYDSISHLSLSFLDSSLLSFFQPKLCITSRLVDNNNNNNNNNNNDSNDSNKKNIERDIIKNVTKVYADAYLKSMYTFLLLSQPQLENNIVRENVMKAISLCTETATHIDITKYIFILALLNQRDDNLLLERDQHLLNKKWKSIVRKSFVPMKMDYINISSKETRQQNNVIYYYQPFSHMNPYLKSKISANCQGDFIEFHHIIQYCQHPLFIRFDCTNNKPTCKHASPIITLSETMKEMAEQVTIADNIDKNDYLNSIFENNDRHSIIQNGITMLLNLVYLTISPPSKAKRNKEEVNEEKDINSFSSLSNQSTHSYPHIYQRDVIDYMIGSLKTLFTEQTLYLLLIFYKSHPNMVIPLSILKYLEHQLSTANHLHQAVPFTFVKHPKRSLRILMDQLELYPNLKRHDNYFYSCEQEYWLLLIVNKQQVDIYCYFINTGLDSMFQPSEEITTAIFKKNLDILSKVEKKTNQIILLQHLHITRLCSKYLEASFMSEQNDGINGEIVGSYSSNNSIGSSNDDSIEEEEEEDKEEEEEEDNDDDKINMDKSKLEPNQFKCPMVYQKKFPLHWRVPFGKTLNHLKSEVLRPFMVRNRSDMYVIEKDDIIVYCKLYETTTNNENTSIHIPTLRQQQQNPDQLEENEKQFSSATSSLNNHTNNELVLEVFGLGCPDWIINDFTQLLDNRLFSEITLKELQTFFSRNPSSKPSLEDVQFLLSFEKRQPYHKRQLLTIPKLVNNPIKFLNYYKKAILNCDTIKPFRGVHVITEVQKYQRYWFYHMMYNMKINQMDFKLKDKNWFSHNGNEDNEDNEGNTGYEMDHDVDNEDEGQVLEKDELCFYYNLTKRIPSKSNSKIQVNGGEGMAGICMSITTTQKIITHQFSSSSFQFDPQLIKQNLKKFYYSTNKIDQYDIRKNDSDDRGNDDADYLLWIDLWTIGPVDDTVLMNYFYQTFRQALCDYFIEQTVSIDLGSIMLSDTNILQSIDTHVHTHRQISTIIRKKFIDTILYMLKISLAWKNPIVNEVSKSININPWNMKEIIQHLDKQLVQIDPFFEPTVTWKKVPSHFDLTTHIDHPHSDDDHGIASDMNESGYIDDDGDDSDDSDWLLYRGKPIYCRNNVQQNIKMVAISGLNEFVEQFGGGGLHHPSILSFMDDNTLTTVTTNSSHQFSNSHYHRLFQENDYMDCRRSSIDTSKSSRIDSRRTSSGSRETNLSAGTTTHIHPILTRSYSSSTTNSYLKPNESNKQQQQQQQQSPSLINNIIITTDMDDSMLVPQLDREKHCFFIMIMDIQHVTMYAYNWSLSSCQPLFNTMMNIIHRQQLRSDVLSNILHQKMGLFHHTIRMKDMANNYVSGYQVSEGALLSPSTSQVIHYIPTMASSNSATATATNTDSNNTVDQSIAPTQTTSTIPLRKKSMITFDQKSTHRKKDNSLNSHSSQKREDSMDSKDDNTSKKKLSKKKRVSTNTITDMNIRDVIMLPVDEGEEEHDTLSISANTTMAPSIHLSSRLSMIHQPELNFVLMDLITTSIFDNYRYSSSTSSSASSNYYYYYNLLREDDLLRRHGYTFIKTYIRQSNLKSFHKKALHIYSKWCRRYGELSLLTNTIQHYQHQQKYDTATVNNGDNSKKNDGDLIDEGERLTRYEVGEILRTARLLHFCRSPFFFGNHQHEHNHLPLSYCSMPISSINKLPTPTSNHSIQLENINEDMVKLWYKDLLSSFVTHYTTYLEKLNMQPIEFASQDNDDEHYRIHYSIDEDTWAKTNCSMPTNSTSASIYSNSDSTHRKRKQKKQENGKYREYDDMEKDSEDEDSNEANRLCYSTIDIGHNISLDYPVVFLLKVFDGGSIICEIRFTRHCFVSVTLYALHRHYGRMGYDRYRREDNETKRFNLKRFEENVSQFRHSIHINSFVYDFHLYYVQHTLLKMNQYIATNISASINETYDDNPNNNQQGFTDGIYLLKVLHQFSSFYKTPVRFSTNRLFHGVYEFKYDESLTAQDFFQYLYLQCQHFEFSRIVENKTNVGICFTTSNITFCQNNNEDTSTSTLDDLNWKHTLVLCPISSTLSYKEEKEEEQGKEEEKNKIYIRYFIISVYQPEKSPFHMVKNIWKSNIAPNIFDLITNARKKIDQIITHISHYHQRKVDWQTIYQYSQQHQRDNNDKDLKTLQLLKKFPTISLSALDMNVHRLLDLNAVGWHEFIELFLQIQKRSSSNIITLFEDTHYQHILFYPPSTSPSLSNNDKELYMDFLIDLKIRLVKKYHGEPMIDANLIRRESPLDKLQSTPEEKSYLASFGQTICYLLWKKCHS